MVVVVDHGGTIIVLQRPQLDLVGWPPDEWSARRSRRSCRNVCTRATPTETATPTAHRRGRWAAACCSLRCIAGHEVPVEIALSPLRGELGEVAATVATVRDVTERLETPPSCRRPDATRGARRSGSHRPRAARQRDPTALRRRAPPAGVERSSRHRPRVSAVVNEIDEAIREIRGVIFTLHRPSQLESGLAAALRASISEAARLLGHSPTLRLSGVLGSIPPGLGAELLTVLRETLMNVAKHAEATRTEVSVDVGSEVGHPRGQRRRCRHARFRERSEPAASVLRNISERASQSGWSREFSNGEPRWHGGPLGRCLGWSPRAEPLVSGRTWRGRRRPQPRCAGSCPASSGSTTCSS